MSSRTKLTLAAVLIIAGIGAIAGGYAWFSIGSGSQLTMVLIGSIMTTIGAVTALQHWIQSADAGTGSFWWMLTDPTLSPGCGAILIASLQIIAGVFCLIVSIVYAWDVHWGLGIALASIAGACFSAAIITIRED